MPRSRDKTSRKNKQNVDYVTMRNIHDCYGKPKRLHLRSTSYIYAFTLDAQRTRRLLETRTQKSQSLYKKAQIRDNIERYRIGPMNVNCIHCNARHFKTEQVSRKQRSFMDCCAHGKVKLKVAPKYPDVLKELFVTEYPEKKTFSKTYDV